MTRTDFPELCTGRDGFEFFDFLPARPTVTAGRDFFIRGVQMVMEIDAQLPSPVVVNQPPHLLGECRLNLEQNQFCVALFAFKDQRLLFSAKQRIS